jgi:hypothetical protein
MSSKKHATAKRKITHVEKTLEEFANLPAAEVIAAAIVEDLRAARAQVAERGLWGASDIDPKAHSPNERERLRQIAADLKR